MGFIKEDYEAVRRKRAVMISLGAIVAIVVVIVLFTVVFKKSPGEATEPGTGDSQSASNVENVANSTDSGSASQGSGKTKDLPTIIRETRRSVVLIQTFDRQGNTLGVGSGFFVTETGDIISNRHVFRGAHHAEAETANGKFKIAKVLAQNSSKDLVRFSLGRTGKRFQPLKMSDSTPQVGESIMVIGNPMGLEATVSNGIVSASRNFPPFGNVIQITCPISPGSSGSPVLNMKGEVVGVATFQMVKGQNLNFAIPIAHAKALKPEEGQELADVNFESSQLIESIEDPFDQGVIHYSRQEYEGAISCFEKALESDPRNAEAYYHLGLCYKEVQTTNAVEAFKKAIELKPDYAEAYFNLGVTYLLLNMQEEAITVLRKAREINPDNDEALLHLGIAYGMARQYDSAISVLKKSVDIFPDTKAYYYLGASYSATKQYDLAISAFRQSIEIDPENLDAFIGLGACYVMVENWRQGIITMNKAVLLDPANSEVHYILGIMHLGNRDLESAELELQLLNRQNASSRMCADLSNAITRYKVANGIR